MKKTTIIESVAILYEILFLYTGISKLMEYSVFKVQIADSPVLPAFAKPIALSIPWLEFALVILLFIPRWRLIGLYGSLILMTLFTGYIIAILSSGDQLPCSCGGIIELMSWDQHLIFNGVFILLAIIASILQKQHIKAQRPLNSTAAYPG